MTETIVEAGAPARLPKAPPRPSVNARARKTARDLALLDEMESFFAPLTKDTPPLRDDAVALSYEPVEEEDNSA